MQLEWDFDQTRPPPETAAEAPEAAAPPPRDAGSVAGGAAALETRAAELQTRLREASGRPVALRINNNRRTMISMRQNRDTGVIRLSVHRLLIAGPARVHDAIAAWVRNPGGGAHLDALRGYFDGQHAAPGPAPPPARRRIVLRPRGQCFDLEALRDEVNAAEFDGALDVPITWGRFSRKRARRTVRFGSYDAEANLVRINPLLDQAFVPRFVVRYIVFHEMLHARLGIKESPSGRRSIHHAEFNRRERAYPDFARADAWLKSPEAQRRFFARR